MADLAENSHTGAERFIGDYVRTFARLLDPNLPPSSIKASVIEEEGWSWGQKAAFLTLSSAALWLMVAAIIYSFA